MFRSNIMRKQHCNSLGINNNVINYGRFTTTKKTLWVGLEWTNFFRRILYKLRHWLFYSHLTITNSPTDISGILWTLQTYSPSLCLWFIMNSFNRKSNFAQKRYGFNYHYGKQQTGRTILIKFVYINLRVTCVQRNVLLLIKTDCNGSQLGLSRIYQFILSRNFIHFVIYKRTTSLPVQVWSVSSFERILALNDLHIISPASDLLQWLGTITRLWSFSRSIGAPREKTISR